MPRVSEIIAQAAAGGVWDHNAQVATVWADMAPALHGACLDAAYAMARARIDPRGLQTAWALCEEVANAVYQATGLKGRESPLMSWAGMNAAQRSAAIVATEAAYRTVPIVADESLDYPSELEGRS